MRINNRIDQTYDELQVGQIFRSGGRTVTETDVVNFCALTGNWIEIHSNVKYASKTRFGKRLVKGSLTYAIVTGLIQFGLGSRRTMASTTCAFSARSASATPSTPCAKS